MRTIKLTNSGLQRHKQKQGSSPLELPSLPKTAAFKRLAATLGFSESEAILARKASGHGSKQGYALPQVSSPLFNKHVTVTCHMSQFQQVPCSLRLWDGPV